MKKFLLSVGVVLTSLVSNAQYFTASAGADFTNFSLVDADTNTWGVYDLTGSTLPAPLVAQGEVLMSFSYDNNLGPLVPDNFIITPVIDLSAVSGTVALHFKLGSPETTASGWYEEYVSVYAFDGVGGFAAAVAGTPVYAGALTAGEQMFSFDYDISSFAGSDSLMIAFRHHNCTDENFVVLDDINVNSSLGLDNNTINATVFPNPANDVLNFNLSVNATSVSIIGLDGKVISTEAINANTAAVNVSNLVAGVYFYEIVAENGTVVRNTFVKK